MVLTYYIYAITESRIKKDLPSPVNLQLNNYSIEHTPSKLSTGGWPTGKIESIFIEIICSKSANGSRLHI